MPLDIDKLMNALENENNESIVELDMKNISAIKNDVLQQLPITSEELKKLNKQLKSYRFVDNVKEINYGNYIRWIPLKKIINNNNDDDDVSNPNVNKIKLTNGGFICDMKVINNMVYIYCKNSMNMIFNLTLDDNIIFQKLNSQEQVILSAIKYINK